MTKAPTRAELMQEIDALTVRVQNLTNDVTRLIEKAERKIDLPKMDLDTVISWTVPLGETVYTYVAVKTRQGWYTTAKIGPLARGGISDEILGRYLIQAKAVWIATDWSQVKR